MSGMSEFSDLELKAQQRACQHVANMLSTPDKLEKVKKVTSLFGQMDSQ